MPSVRVHSNIGLNPDRRPALQFSGKAFSAVNPNTLNGGAPSRINAMGIATQNGNISMMHDGGAGVSFTLYIWNDNVNRLNSAQGWVAYQGTAALSTQSVDGFSISTWQVPENSIFCFVAATNTPTNCWLGGTRAYNGNPLPDLTPTTTP